MAVGLYAVPLGQPNSAMTTAPGAMLAATVAAGPSADLASFGLAASDGSSAMVLQGLQTKGAAAKAGAAAKQVSKRIRKYTWFYL